MAMTLRHAGGTTPAYYFVALADGTALTVPMPRPEAEEWLKIFWATVDLTEWAARSQALVELVKEVL